MNLSDVFSIMQTGLLYLSSARDFSALVCVSKSMKVTRVVRIAMRYARQVVMDRTRRERVLLVKMLDHMNLQSVQVEEARASLAVLRLNLMRVRHEREEFEAESERRVRDLRRHLARAADEAAEYRRRYRRLSFS